MMRNFFKLIFRINQFVRFDTVPCSIGDHIPRDFINIQFMVYNRSPKVVDTDTDCVLYKGIEFVRFFKRLAICFRKQKFTRVRFK